MTAIRAALFDVDGTLLDSNELRVKAWRRAFADFDIPVPLRALRGQMGNRGDRLAAALCPPGAADALGGKLVQRHADIFARDYLHRVRPFPGVRRLFNRLRADGVRVVLASQDWERERHIEILGVRGLVEEDVLAAPRDTIAVGDSPYDALAARQAGMQAIGVLTGGYDKRTLWDAGARFVYRDIADLLEAYESSPLAILDDGDGDDEPPRAAQPAVSARRESPSAGPRYR